MTNRQPFIEQIAADMGFRSGTIDKWRQRAVPYRHRLPIMAEAAKRGIALVERDFQFKRKMGLRKRRKV